MTHEQRLARSENLRKHYQNISRSQLEIFLEHASQRLAELNARGDLCHDEIEVIKKILGRG